MSMRLFRLIPLLISASLASLMIGCEAQERNLNGGGDAAPIEARDGTDTEGAERPAILFLGTSLTAGYGLSDDQAFPALIQQKIDSAGLGFQTVNAGVSGETSAGARRRIDRIMRQPFEVLVLETGANDMLRGADLDSTRANIQAIIDQVREQRPQARIVLAGMMAPPNLGRSYADRFNSMFYEIAEENDIPLVPFILENVGGEPDLNLADGIHPNAEGQRIVAENIWRVLEPQLTGEGR